MADPNRVDNRELEVTESNGSIATRDSSRYIVPAVDIFETGDGLTLLVDMPGVDKEQLDIRVEENLLTIHAGVPDEGGAEPFYREYRRAPYYRRFALNEYVDREKIGADYNNGVLTVHLPKAEHARPKQIEVKVS